MRALLAQKVQTDDGYLYRIGAACVRCCMYMFNMTSKANAKSPRYTLRPYIPNCNNYRIKETRPRTDWHAMRFVEMRGCVGIRLELNVCIRTSSSTGTLALDLKPALVPKFMHMGRVARVSRPTYFPGTRFRFDNYMCQSADQRLIPGQIEEQ